MTDKERDFQYLPHDEILDYQIDHLRELMAGDWQNAPGFVRRLEEAGVGPDDLKEAADLTKFPILKKSDLKTIQAQDPPFGGLITVPPGRLRRIYSSPGPIYCPEAHERSYYRWERALSACGFKEGDIVMNCFSYHLTPAGEMFEEGENNLGCAVVPAGIGSSEIQAAVAAQLKAGAYVGLPSYLQVVLDKAAEAGLELSFEKAFVIAEKLPESLRARFQEQYGIYVRQGYGTAEVGAIAYECHEADGMHFDPSVLVELLDPETGEPVPAGDTGEVVVSVLNRYNTLFRFATGDLSAVNFEECPCGRKSPRLMGILGRADDITKVRGLFVHPAQLAAMMETFQEVTRYRGVILRERAMDDMIIEVESDRELTEQQLKGIARRAKEVIKISLNTVQVPSGTIPEDAKPLDDRRKWD